MTHVDAAPVALGYLVIETARVAEWHEFATRLLGLQAEDDGAGGLRLRLDERAARILVRPGAREAVAAAGWEMRDAAALSATCEALRQAGHEVVQGSIELARQRCVADLVHVADPVGNRVELFHGAIDADRPFEPGRALSGFRTGPLGLGHAVYAVADIAAVAPFYTAMLGFRLSDRALAPFAAAFFHLNARHHSLAMIETGRNGFHHLLLELDSLDDVGQAYDLAQLDAGRVAVTLGRHANDFMTSFYIASPSGFMIEYGWGGRSIDPAAWQPFDSADGPSMWGHERAWLSAEQRADALRLRLDAAARGLRAPDPVRSEP